MFFTRLATTTSDLCFRYVISDFYRGDLYTHGLNLGSRGGFVRDIEALFGMSMIADIFQEEEEL